MTVHEPKMYFPRTLTRVSESLLGQASILLDDYVFLQQVFYKERLSGHYGIAVYILSNFLSSFPFVAVMSIATGAITYYMVKFRPEFSHFLYICLDLTSSIAVVESSMMIIASLVPNFLMGLILGAGYIVRNLNFIIHDEPLLLQLKRQLFFFFLSN